MQPRHDFTHNSGKLRQISQENSILVEKIAKISARGTGNAELGLPSKKTPDTYVPQHLKVGQAAEGRTAGPLALSLYAWGKLGAVQARAVWGS